MSKKRIMINGAMQSGKTEYTVRTALENQEPSNIEVFIHYSTNESMESTNEKIKRYDVELFSGLEALKRFHLRLTRGGIDSDSDKKYVLSLIAHHSSLEALKKIITAYHTAFAGHIFNISIDEDDTLALDHSVKKGKPVQKQRLAQALIEMPSVQTVRNITATPFAEHLSETDFDVIGMMRWQEPLNNISHLTKKINSNDRISIHYADLNDYSSITKALNIIKPDFISHLAAQSYPKTSFDIPLETLQTNIIGTANLLENIRFLNSENGYNPIIHICSSSEVYGKATTGTSLKENTPFHGASPYSISKIGTDYLGQFYGEAYGLKTFVTRMGTHSGPRRSDVFFESTVAKQIALIEAGLQEPYIKVGNLESTRTFQDARDAVKAYFLLLQESYNGNIRCGDYFNIAGSEAFKLTDVVKILLDMSHVKNIKVKVDVDRLRPIDADYQMFDNEKIMKAIDWKPVIPVKVMFKDLLNHWRLEIGNGVIPLSR